MHGSPHVRQSGGRLLGLSLVELLVCLSIITMVVGAAVAALTGGFRVWERATTRGQDDQWVQVAMEELRRDLQGLRRFQPIPFEGEYDQLSFPTVVDAGGPTEPEALEMGRVGYVFRSLTRELCRSVTPYRQMRSRSLTDDCQPVLDHLRSIRFSYYVVDQDDEVAEWMSSWSEEDPPLAVKLEIRYDEAATQRPMTQTILVPIPTATIR